MVKISSVFANLHLTSYPLCFSSGTQNFEYTFFLVQQINIFDAV